MRTAIVMLVLASLCACAKKKSEDKAAPAAVEQQPTKATGAEGGAPGSALPTPEVKGATPADDGGELEKKMTTPKPQPADDGGEATKKACGKTEECGANHDCCNGFCWKQGTAQHSIECKLPSGKL